MPTDLSELLGRARAGGRNRIAVAAAGDMHVLEAVRAAAEAGIAEAVLVGAKDGILAAAREIRMDPGGWEIIDIPDPAEACRKAVALVREGRAEILMKGLVSTALLMKAVLDKEGGLRTGALLSHAGIFQSPHYGKLFAVTDAAMNVAPDFEEKVGILTNAVGMFHRLGV